MWMTRGRGGEERRKRLLFWNVKIGWTEDDYWSSLENRSIKICTIFLIKKLKNEFYINFIEKKISQNIDIWRYYYNFLYFSINRSQIWVVCFIPLLFPFRSPPIRKPERSSRKSVTSSSYRYRPQINCISLRSTHRITSIRQRKVYIQSIIYWILFIMAAMQNGHGNKAGDWVDKIENMGKHGRGVDTLSFTSFRGRFVSFLTIHEITLTILLMKYNTFS